jgi:hypothetical protein
MNNQHAGLNQVLAEQRITQLRQQAAQARLGHDAGPPPRRRRSWRRRGRWRLAPRPAGQPSPPSQPAAPVASADRSVATIPRPKPPSGPWATLLGVAWLAIVLGLLLQLALLLVAAGFGTVAGSRSLLAETCRTLCWSLLVCVGVALGRVAAKGRLPLEGVTGLLAAPLALTAANAVQKGVAEALNAAGPHPGLAPLWVLAIKAAEYACLGLALEWVGRRAWGSALGHMAVGLATGVVFGGVFLTVVVQSANPPPFTPSLVAKGINELLFPIGCALVVFIAEVLRTHLDPPVADDRPQRTSGAAAEEPTPYPSPGGVNFRPGTLTVGPLCELERGHWACVSHRRNFHTRRSLDRHTRLGEHRVVWLCWAHGPEQPSHGRPGHPAGHRPATDRLSRRLVKLGQRGHRRSAGRSARDPQPDASTPCSCHPLRVLPEGRSKLQGEGAQDRGQPAPSSTRTLGRVD